MNSATLMNTPDTGDNDTPRHPIQVVARRTGLSADVIRVWERRYGAVQPIRQQRGRRLYSDGEVQRLALLQRATSAGRRISEVAGLPDAELESLVAEDRQNHSPLLVGNSATGGTSAHVGEALDAVRALDPERLHRTLVNASTELPLPLFLEQVVGELLVRVGDAWEQGQLRIAHEHMASAVARRLLAGMLGRERNSGPLVVLATPAGQQHEIGVLLAAISAESEGFRVLYLGPDLPASEIAAAAIQREAIAVALGVQSRGDRRVLAEELRQLRLALPDSTRLIVGGRAVDELRTLLEDLGVLTPTNLAGFREVLSAP